MVVYPVLVSEIARRGIKKCAIAKRLGISDKSLSNKMVGRTQFSWPEVLAIQKTFFPDLTPDELFASDQTGE